MMRALLTLVTAAGAAAFTVPQLLADEVPAAPWGDYVEARDATVFGGACHYQSEFGSRGREAVLAWDFEGGGCGGVDLGGLDAVALVSGGGNLADAVTRRTARVYLPASAAPEVREAASTWLRENHTADLGEFTVVLADIEVEGGEVFRVAVDDGILLEGDALPDRACCTMPFNVWYEPFERVDDAVVGYASTFRVEEPALGLRFDLGGENCAFTGRFGR